jgi:GT2 family glycosyltransferase
MGITMQKVNVVIPFFNGDDHIEKCLDSLKENSAEIYRIIIVNNSNKPTNIHRIAKCYNNVDVIETKPRLGFGNACNEGAQYALKNGAEIIICINQDVILGPTAVTELIQPLGENDNVVMSAPILYTYDFKHLGSYFLKWYLSQCPDLIFDALKNKLKKNYQTQAACGACFAIKSEFVKEFGLFDPLFFMYREDDDLCERIIRLRFYIVIVPSAAVAHYQRDVNLTVKNWQRFSSAILELKDPRKSFLNAVANKSLKIFLEDLRLLMTFRFVRLYNNIISDAKLVTSLAKVLKRRNFEAVLLKKRDL